MIAQDNLPINEKWSFSYEQVNCRSSIINLDLNLIETQLKRSIFSSLRSLFVCTTNLSYISSSFIETLNSLHQVERLELPFILLNKKSTLSLLNLIVLSIKQVHGNLLRINTRNLQKLKIQSSLDNLDFVYLDKIKYLDCIEYESYLNRFLNLEYLYVLNIINLDDDLLFNLIKLKEIHFEHDHFAFYSLVNQKRILDDRQQLSIYHQGLKKGDYLEHDLNYGSDSLNDENIQIYLSNYTELANQLTFIKYINYSSWQSNELSIPDDFIKKFVNLNGIWITEKIDNQVKFIRLLNDCVSFSFLKLNYSQLTQLFYCQLPRLCSTIKNLEIKDEQKLIDNLDFSFIFKLDYLNSLTTNKRIQFDFVYLAFRQLPKFCNFTFKKLDSKDSDSDLIRIHHFKKNVELCINQSTYFYDNLDDLFVKIKEL